jgi:hypothetical protein
MASAGFRLALNYTAWYGNSQDLLAYANEAQADGIKLIWPLDGPAWRNEQPFDSAYPKLAADCGCGTYADFVHYAIGLTQSLPATWGYYIGDELPASEAPAVAALAAAVRSQDGQHPLLFVGRGENPQANLTPFLNTADVIGADMYPIGLGGSPSAVGWVSGKLHALTAAANRSSAMVLQAFTWSQYPAEVASPTARWPTESEMQNMRDQALTRNPSMILWYSLKDILQSDNPAGHWQDLVNAAFAPTTSCNVTTFISHTARASVARVARSARRRRSNPRAVAAACGATTRSHVRRLRDRTARKRRRR